MADEEVLGAPEEPINILGAQTLVLSSADVGLIVATLRKLPYEQVANTLDRIKAQLVKQQRRAPPAPEHRILRECFAADAARARTADPSAAAVPEGA